MKYYHFEKGSLKLPGHDQVWIYMYYRSSDVRAFQNPLEYFLSLQLMCVSYLIRIFMFQLELNGILVDI